MTTANTTTRATPRRTIDDPKENTDRPSEILEDEEPIIADITEQQKGKTLRYKAPIKPAIEEPEIELEDDEEEIPPPEIVRLDPVAQMFADMREAEQYPGESFMAVIQRHTDTMQDRFNYPYTGQAMTYPPLQLTSQDAFNFIKVLQGYNNNSGGRFSITICRQDGEPAMVSVYRGGVPVPGWERPIQIKSFVIPNPPPETLSQNGLTEQGGLFRFLEQMQRQQQEFMANMQNMIRQNQGPREPTPLERAIEAKIIAEVAGSGSNKDDKGFFREFMLMPAMAQGMAEMMRDAMKRPEPITPEPPTVVDQILKVVETPLVSNIVDGATNILEAIAVQKMKLQGEENAGQAEQIPQQNPQGLPGQVTDDNESDMNESDQLLLTIIDELESNNPLNGDNATLLALAQQFPSEFGMLIGFCKAPFATVQKSLTLRLKAARQDVLMEFLDLERTNAVGKFVYNERGQNMLRRLEELHGYLATLELPE